MAAALALRTLQVRHQLGIEEAGEHELADVVQKRGRIRFWRDLHLAHRAHGFGRERGGHGMSPQHVLGQPEFGHGLLELLADFGAKSEGQHGAPPKANHGILHRCDGRTRGAGRRVRGTQGAAGQRLVQADHLDEALQGGIGIGDQICELRPAHGDGLKVVGFGDELMKVEHGSLVCVRF